MSLKRKTAEVASDAAKRPKAAANSSITAFFSSPKSSSTSSQPKSDPKSIQFDKDEWVSKLSEEQRQLLQLEINTLHESWLAVLQDEITSTEFLDLKRFLMREVTAGKKVFPPSEDVYSWSRHTPLPTVKAVILGQDPYHNIDQAHGLCFSVRPPTKAPPSLKNIYIALKKDYPEFKPPPNGLGLLTPWADRGVLMLNSCLTVEAHKANSHAGKGWERLTQKVMDAVAATRTRGLVFLAWGKPAELRCKNIDRNRHLVLKTVHPSPLSASRGFFDCHHFKLANDWLEQKYGSDGIIDWNLDV